MGTRVDKTALALRYSGEGLPLSSERGTALSKAQSELAPRVVHPPLEQEETPRPPRLGLPEPGGPTPDAGNPRATPKEARPKASRTGTRRAFRKIGTGALSGDEEDAVTATPVPAQTWFIRHGQTQEVSICWRGARDPLSRTQSFSPVLPGTFARTTEGVPGLAPKLQKYEHALPTRATRISPF